MKTQNKDKTIGVRFTLKEYKRIKSRAEKAGMTVSDYIRDIVLNGKKEVIAKLVSQKTMESVIQARDICNYVIEKYGQYMEIDEALEEKVKKLWKSLS